MYGYIAFNDFVNATARSDDDVYEFMAGSSFDANYAAGVGYNPLSLPTPDLRSFFISQSFGLTASLLKFNEDFAEFALLPIQILLTNEREFDIKAMINDIQKATDKIKFIKAKTKNDTGGFSSNFNSDGSLKQKGAVGSFNEFAREVMFDSKFEDTLEQIGSMYMGPAGGAVAGMVYDSVANGRFVGANVAEAVYASVKNMALNTAVKTAVRALGTSLSVGTNFAVVGVVSAFVNEMFEVVTGLDSSFGFGGDLVGFDDMGHAVYEAPLGFTDGIKDMFGKLGYKELMYDKQSYEYGQIAGAMIGGRMYVGQWGDTLMSSRNITRQKEFKEIEKQARQDAEWMAKDTNTFGVEKNGDGGSNRNKDNGGMGVGNGHNDGTGASGGSWA